MEESDSREEEIDSLAIDGGEMAKEELENRTGS
jgi:hypothetical protein